MPLPRQLGSLIFVAAAFGALPVHAREVTDIAAYERTIVDDFCGTIAFDPGFVSDIDLNGDAFPDAIVDYGKLLCDGTYTGFCGSGGCTQRFYVGIAPGRFVEAGEILAYGVSVEVVGGARRIAIALPGNQCPMDHDGPCYLYARVGADNMIEEIE